MSGGEKKGGRDVMHDGCRHCVPCTLERIESATIRMETWMATAAEQINNLTGKVDGLGAVVGDIASDFAAFRDAMLAERENLTESGQAALDNANTSLENVKARLDELDLAVGDADGSDVPAEEPGGEDNPGGEDPGTGTGTGDDEVPGSEPGTGDPSEGEPQQF